MADRRKPRGKGEPAPTRRRRRPAADDQAAKKPRSAGGWVLRVTGGAVKTVGGGLARLVLNVLLVAAVFGVAYWLITSNEFGRGLLDAARAGLAAARDALGAAW